MYAFQNKQSREITPQTRNRKNSTINYVNIFELQIDYKCFFRCWIDSVFFFHCTNVSSSSFDAEM